MKKLLTAVLVLLLCQTAAMAVPAYPGKRVMKMADGTEVTVTLKGDEFMHYFQAEDGRAMRLVDGVLQEIPAFDLLMAKSKARDLADAGTTRRAVRVKHRAEYKGHKKGLVILVNFSDNEFSVPDPQKTFDEFFNKKGYTDYGMKGSVSDYFSAQSYGQFQLDFDVVGPYRLPSTMKYYGGSLGDAHDRDSKAMIVDAVRAANPDVNFKDYDWDSDGYVDQVFVIYAGYGENYGASSDCIWPHESSIDGKGVMYDGVHLGTYACSCELKGVSGKQIDGIGAACHEFSHCLGIADHYDTEGNNFGMGPWDLMCSGSYNDGSCCPAAYTSYERWMSGWLEPVEVSDLTEVKDMKPLVESPEAYVLYNEANRNEYYLLENRQKVGFDEALYGHGLLVVHVDYNETTWKSNSVNVGDRQRMTIIAADDEYGNYQISSLEGDPFPGIQGVTSLTDVSKPAAVVNTRNKDKSYLMHKPIECITEDEKGHISMILCAAPLPTPVLSTPTDVTPTSFRIAWDAVEGADKYELVLDANNRKSSLEEAVLLDEDFSSCYSKSAGFSDISKEIAKYLPGFSGSKLFTTPDYLRIGTGTAAGYLNSPVFKEGRTGDLTIVMKVKPYKDGTAVKGLVKITTNTPETNQTFDFNFDSETTLVLHSYVKVLEVFRIDINPTSAMYMSGLTVYDGNFSEEEMGMTPSPAKVLHRVLVKELMTTETSYQFSDLDPGCEYTVKVRAWQGSRCSDWSEAMPVDGPNAIILPLSEAPSREESTYYDLQGRRIATPTRGLYIHDGKKVMVK